MWTYCVDVRGPLGKDHDSPPRFGEAFDFGRFGEEKTPCSEIFLLRAPGSTVGSVIYCVWNRKVVN
jgi:hypothetical protein